MKYWSRTASIITGEILIFAGMLAVIWLDEFFDVPCHLLGAPPTPYRQEEFNIEMASCALVCIVVIIGTLVLLRRLERMERFLRVCAWCKKVCLDDRWVAFEEYMAEEHTLQSTHGICPECLGKINPKAHDQAENPQRKE